MPICAVFGSESRAERVQQYNRSSKNNKLGCCQKTTLYKIGMFIGALFLTLGIIGAIAVYGNSHSPFFLNAKKFVEGVAERWGVDAYDLTIIVATAGGGLALTCALTYWYNCCRSKYPPKIEANKLKPRDMVRERQERAPAKTAAAAEGAAEASAEQAEAEKVEENAQGPAPEPAPAIATAAAAEAAEQEPLLRRAPAVPVKRTAAPKRRPAPAKGKHIVSLMKRFQPGTLREPVKP